MNIYIVRIIKLLWTFDLMDFTRGNTILYALNPLLAWRSPIDE